MGTVVCLALFPVFLSIILSLISMCFLFGMKDENLRFDGINLGENVKIKMSRERTVTIR